MLPENTAVSTEVVHVEVENFKLNTNIGYDTKFDVTLKTSHLQLFEYDKASKSIKTNAPFDYETMAKDYVLVVEACSIGLPQQM